MALELNIKTILLQQSNGTEVWLKDNTGDYNLSTNPTGWGDGTTAPARSGVTEIVIAVEKGSISYTKTLSIQADIDAYMTGEGVTLTSLDVLGSEYTTFEDGIYTFQITFSGTWNGSPSPYETIDQKDEYFLWSMWCDIRKLTKTLEVPITNYLESYNIALLNALFHDILYLCQYGESEKATEVYTFVRNTLDNETVLTELFKNFKNYA